MTNNYLKSITEILDYDFYVPSYQRGYRWTESQVIDLLEDIWEFADTSEKKEGEFYCLQPLIVKFDKNKNHYIVIDGQQRLTTIHILLTYLKFIFKESFKDIFGRDNKYSINYQTRPNSNNFLEIELEEILKKINSIGKIDENNKDQFVDKSNIDYYFMTKTLLTIKQWFDDRKISKVDFVNTLLKHNKKENKDTANNIRFIWYEIENTESEIDVFTRTNSGKIPLTNAELIKALFLNNKNFNKAEKDLRQIEIAKEWDEIEYFLQNDEFWYFITKNKDYATRIELIFEIFTNRQNSDDIAVYKYFTKQENILELWDKSEENIKKVFSSLKHWFENRKLYHIIGYLISTEKLDTNSIYHQFKNKKKTEFENDILQKIKSEIDLDKIETFNYDDDRKKILNVLLLFNIATILNNSESYIKFAFDKFNLENWSIEHIHAQQDKGFNTSEIIQKWLKDVKEEIVKIENSEIALNIISAIDNVLSFNKINKDDDKFLSLKKNIFDFFGEPEINTIDNLALLSSKVNSALSNNIFPLKRKILIEKDKKGEFIPICSKNVFLKYYTEDIKNINFWNSQDRKNYLSEIKKVLEKL